MRKGDARFPSTVPTSVSLLCWSPASDLSATMPCLSLLKYGEKIRAI